MIESTRRAKMPITTGARWFAGAVVVAIGAGFGSSAAAIELRQVSRPQFVNVDQPLSTYKHPVWRSDGQAIAALAAPWDRFDPGDGLVGFDLNGDLLQWPRLTVGGRAAERPALDRTQTRAAFSGFVHLVGNGLFVTPPPMQPPGDPVNVLQDGRLPAWSPAGDGIAIETSAGIRVVSPAGDLMHVVSNRADDETPAWSPDGSRVVFSTTLGGARDLWLKDLLSGSMRPVTQDAGQDRWPSWSPDGRWILYEGDAAGSWDLWVTTADGGTPVRLTDLPGAEQAPAWSPDGTRIAFQHQEQIWVATDLPEFLIAVSPTTWSRVKSLYRGGSR